MLYLFIFIIFSLFFCLINRSLLKTTINLILGIEKWFPCRPNSEQKKKTPQLAHPLTTFYMQLLQSGSIFNSDLLFKKKEGTCNEFVVEERTLNVKRIKINHILYIEKTIFLVKYIIF